MRAILATAARSQGLLLMRQFTQACMAVEETQAVVLAEILAQQAESERGRALGLGAIDTVKAFRQRVPLSTYEDHREWIDRIRDTGRTDVMFDPSERLLMLALTSGSEDEPKHIPVTTESYARYRRGWITWVAAALRDHRNCFQSHILGVVSPAEERRTKSGIPCGAMSGLSLETQSRFIRNIYAIPAPVFGIPSHADKYYAIVRLASAQAVSMLVTANPSSMLMLAQTMDARSEDIIRDIHDGTLSIDLSGASDALREFVAALRPDPKRARRLRHIRKRSGHLYPLTVWPELALMTNWKGGTLGHYLSLYPEVYGDTPVRDIGLIASEGRMTIPMRDEGSSGPLDLFSHFFEFMPIEEEGTSQPTTLLAHELEAGRQYFLILTNFSGLHRYQIQDVVEVTGFLGQCPEVRFLHKGSRFSSITGEKLSEHQVVNAVHAAGERVGRPFNEFMIVPVFDRVPHHTLILEETTVGPEAGWEEILREVERGLGEQNIEYRSKRDSGRLGHLQLGVVEAGFFNDLRHERVAASGGRSEQYKPTYLINDLEYHESLKIIASGAVAEDSAVSPSP